MKMPTPSPRWLLAGCAVLAAAGGAAAFGYASYVETRRMAMPLAEAGCSARPLLDRAVQGWAGEFIDRNRDGKIDCVNTGAGSHVYIVETAEEAERAFQAYYSAAFASGVFQETCADGTVDKGRIVRTSEGWLTVEHCGIVKGRMSSRYRSPIDKASWPQWYARESSDGRDWQKTFELATH